MGRNRRFLILFLLLFAGCVSASAGEEAFDWRQCSGQTLRVMLNRYPYAEWIKRGLGDFERLTGIRTAFAMYPDDHYFTRLEAAFEEPHAQPDVYITGVHQSWDYAARGRMLALDSYLADSALTNRSYNAGDFYPPIIAAFRGSESPESPDDAGALWAVPVGFAGDDPESARSSLLVFGLAVNPGSENRDAAWLFIQHFTGQAFQTSLIDQWKTISPPRRSVFENPPFQRRLATTDPRK